MNPQEFFDRVYTHAESMPRPALSPKGACSYKSGCFIGIFMTPEQATEADQEQTAVDSLPDDLLPAELKALPMKLLEAVQLSHDTNARNFGWRNLMLQDLRAVAANHNLKVPQQ